MSDPTPDREEHDYKETDRPTSDDSGTPRWVVVFGIILIALILIFVVLQLLGIGGEHGPGRHAWIDPLVPTLPGATA